MSTFNVTRDGVTAMLKLEHVREVLATLFHCRHERRYIFPRWTFILIVSCSVHSVQIRTRNISTIKSMLSSDHVTFVRRASRTTIRFVDSEKLRICTVCVSDEYVVVTFFVVREYEVLYIVASLYPSPVTLFMVHISNQVVRLFGLSTNKVPSSCDRLLMIVSRDTIILSEYISNHSRHAFIGFIQTRARISVAKPLVPTRPKFRHIPSDVIRCITTRIATKAS